MILIQIQKLILRCALKSDMKRFEKTEKLNKWNLDWKKLIQKSFTVCIETWYEAVQSARTLAVVSDFVKKDHHH